MDLAEYFAAVSREMSSRVERMRKGFATHRPSAGSAKEGVVASFLQDYLPTAFRVDAGLVVAASGTFANEADVLIVDATTNCHFFPDESEHVWPIEAVYALLEVKSGLAPSELRDSIAKCRRFKTLPRSFADVPQPPRIPDSLFVVWGWDAPSPSTVKKNLTRLLAEVPIQEQPDFVVVPGSILVSGGGYRRLSELGQVGSHHAMLRETDPQKLSELTSFEVLELRDNAVLVWLLWFTSWLRAAGVRAAPIQNYLGRGKTFGKVV